MLHVYISLKTLQPYICEVELKLTGVYLMFLFYRLLRALIRKKLNEFFLAHLSRRLIGKLIVYPWSGVRRPSVRRPSSVRRSQCSNIFFSETAWPIKAKFYVEPPWVEGTKFCSRHLDHMTKVAAMPIYGKNPSKIFFSRTGGPIFTKLFYGKVKFGNLGFSIGKSENRGFFTNYCSQ